MTSQKSSVNKQAAKFDFKFSFKNIIVPSALTFIVAMIVFVFMPMQEYYYIIRSSGDGDTYYDVMYKNILSVFTTLGYQGRIWLNILAVAGGVLFAFCAFYFLNKKKSVNFFMSTGINRRTMFTNRVLSSAIMIALTTGVPLLIDTIFNISAFGHGAYMLEFGFFAFLGMFSMFMSGFAIMSAAMCMCTTVIDALFSGAFLVVAPYAVVYSVQALLTDLLRGYGDNSDLLSKCAVFTPLFSSSKLGSREFGETLFHSISQMKNTNVAYIDVEYSASSFNSYFNTDGYTHIGYKFFFGALLWIAVSVVLLFVANYCLKKRKAENTAIIRRSKASSIVVSYILGLASIIAVGALLMLAKERVNIPSVLIALICAIVFFLVSAVVQLAAYADIKKPKTYLVTAAAGTIIPLVFALILSFGGFGYTTYVPELSEVESCTVNTSDMNASFGQTYYGDVENLSFFHYYANNNMCSDFTDKADIERVLRAEKTAQKREFYKGYSNATFEFKLKNGKTVTRSFDDITEDAVKALANLTSTKEMQKQVENQFLVPAEDIVETKDYYSVNYNYSSTDAPITQSDAYAYAADGKRFKIDNTLEFRKALLADVKKVGYSRQFTSDRELFVIGFVSTEAGPVDDDTDKFANDENIFVAYSIYDDMTNVLNYLKKVGVYDKVVGHDCTKNVESVTLISVTDKALRSQVEYWNARFAGGITSSKNTDASEIKIIERNGKKYTDKESISKYIKASTVGGYYHDDDMILMIKYKSGDTVLRLLRADKK